MPRIFKTLSSLTAAPSPPCNLGPFSKSSPLTICTHTCFFNSNGCSISWLSDNIPHVEQCFGVHCQSTTRPSGAANNPSFPGLTTSRTNFLCTPAQSRFFPVQSKSEVHVLLLNLRRYTRCGEFRLPALMCWISR